MLKKVGIVLLVVILGLVGFIATRPDAFRVERSVAMAAPPDLVFSIVNDFHNWAQWSPWEKLDPAMKKTFEGPSAGVGASYAWTGNKDVGRGKMTLVAAKPPESIDIKLEFMEPFAATNDCTFSFKGAADQTTVSWAMSGPANFMTKAMGVFVSMDKMIGKDFENGLGNLKALAESEAKKRAEAAKSAAATPPPPAAPQTGTP